MKKFYKTFKSFELKNEPRLNITAVYSQGKNARELIKNLSIDLEDWNGNQGPEYGFYDLCKTDRKKIFLAIKEAV